MGNAPCAANLPVPAPLREFPRITIATSRSTFLPLHERRCEDFCFPNSMSNRTSGVRFGFQFSDFSFTNHVSDFELRIWLTPETWNPFCTLLTDTAHFSGAQQIHQQGNEGRRAKHQQQRAVAVKKAAIK